MVPTINGPSADKPNCYCRYCRRCFSLYLPPSYTARINLAATPRINLAVTPYIDLAATYYGPPYRRVARSWPYYCRPLYYGVARY
jgi:hypothetical protein